jgi:hypothetical protein
MTSPLKCFAALAMAVTTVVPSIAQTCNTANRSVLLVLDASGSMNARLPSAEARIDIARGAIKGVAALIPAEAQLALRLYGSQSPRADKNCHDTLLAVPFGPAGSGGAAIAQAVDGAPAQGYTPIAMVLGEAAKDFPADAKERVVVLVSDGKETCAGDPTIAARALADAGIVVHTVGFIVDTAARMQLQAVAAATGGLYFDAPVGPELPQTLEQALNACAATVVALPPDPGPGFLETTSAWVGLPIVNSETGEQVAEFHRMNTRIELPAGIYEVRFGPGSWKGIEVKPGETTTIAPGDLKLDPSAGVTVVDSETGVEFGSFDRVNNRLTLVPGVYDLKFGDSEWRYVKVDGGTETLLQPPMVKIDSAVPGVDEASVKTADGTVVFRFNRMNNLAVLPPGDYVIEIGDNAIPWPAAEGAVLEINAQ